MPDTTENALKRLFDEGKKYLTLQIDYAKLTATENLSVILGMSVLFIIILVLAVGAGIYLSFALVYLLEPLVGIVGSYALLGALFLLLIALVVIFKQRLILAPITRFISRVLLDNDNDKTPQ
ncbi:phage holin family protein [Barnesiella viscericola]|uniref:phage holin family protein n=1 Tax=Barnesiella viscericola TaxID=397865 RepID=UPI0032094075